MATGTEAYGGYFRSSSVNGKGVFGIAESPTGFNAGGRFETESSSGIGAYGISKSTSGATYGVVGEALSSSGAGVYGYNGASTSGAYGGLFETEGATGRGVLGVTSALGPTDVPMAVRGQASTFTLGYGVYAAGDLGASGVKSFRIDHPFDPENKHLLHYSSESPFPQNFYNGNVTTDTQGKAWVDLPNYFEEINTNFKYILTVVDDSENASFVQAKIGRKIKNNRFLIMTSAPKVEVSWEVKADRNDKRIQVNRPTDEREKHESERGKFEHPEYYNRGPELGMDYSPKRIRPEQPRTRQPISTRKPN